MILRDSFDESSRFEGDRALRWRSIPANSRIISARATVTPLEAGIGIAFGELLRLDGGAGDFGATRTAAVGSTAAWVEVDFHNRRTLARVTGTFPNPTTLEVDVGGGTYVQINRFGAFKSPDDDTPAELFQLSGSSSSLPGLTVAKVKLTNAAAVPVLPVLDSLTIVSVPSNVSLRVGELAPFWTHVGEMTTPETTPDFAEVLQAALTDAPVVNGFHDLSLIVHSDTIARFKIAIEVDFLVEEKPLPDGLPEVVLPFDFSTMPKPAVPPKPGATINLSVPPNSRVVASQTSAKVKGPFAETRIAHGPTGAVTPDATVEVSPACAQAQNIDALTDDVAATAIDLLIEATTPAARLRLDIRADLDGKPDDGSLLPGPVEFSFDKQPEGGARWISVPLPAEFVLAKSDLGGGKKKRYWLVLQTLAGAAAWSVIKAGTLNMQCTRDGGLSWRDSIAIAGSLRDSSISPAGPFTALFRLRDKPNAFKVPIKLQVGDVDPVIVPLDKYQPLGRVDFAIDTELAQGINDYLGKTSAAACPETEHLINPEFELWERVDDTRSIQPFIEIGDNIKDMAFSPDGTLAYVLDQTLKKSLVVIDAGCGQIQQKIPLKFSPQAFAISPDGTRAYVTNGSRIEVVDLTTNKSPGGSFDLELNPSSEQAVNDLAVSPDGARLYAVSLTTVPSKANAIHVIDTASLESELTGGPKSPATRSVKKVSADTEQVAAPVALAVSPEGGLLYMAIARDDVDGMVKVIDTTTFVAAPADIPVVGSPTDIALTPDGVRAVVSNRGDGITGNATVIETAPGTSTTIDLGARGVGVAISPDGALAYVFQGDHFVRVIDIGRAAAIEAFSVPKVASDATAEAIAISPIGDLLYTGQEDDAGNGFISPVQFGTRRPAEWQLTTGVVSPFCLAPPFHLTAILGPDARPSAMSQVTPVAQSCTYEFSFYAIASDSDADDQAMGEVIWLSSQCGFVGSEKVEITRLDAAPVFEAGTPPGKALFAAAPTGGAGSMALHRKRLKPPAGANQAEIRFTAPSGAAAAIDRVSFMATSEASANSDFALQENGRLKDWTVIPAVAPSFAILSLDGEIHFRNAGAAAVELVQTTPAQSGQPFTVELVGRTAAGASSPENLRVEVRWLNTKNAPTGSPAVIEVLRDGLSSSVGRGTVPVDATQAEIHLIVPGRTTQVVKRVSLRFSKETMVPLTFIAESPGDLTISDVRVAFERISSTVPPIPDQGLCIPTAPGCEPGKGSGDSCFCHQCATDKTIVDKKPVVTSASRAGVAGKCDTCGTKLLRLGGPSVPGAEPFSVAGSSAVLQPRVIRSAMATRESLVRGAARAPVSLIDIPGIAEARARQLEEIGIDSVEKLAAATPEKVAEIKFITLEMSARLISEAKAALERVNH